MARTLGSTVPVLPTIGSRPAGDLVRSLGKGFRQDQLLLASLHVVLELIGNGDHAKFKFSALL